MSDKYAKAYGKGSLKDSDIKGVLKMNSLIASNAELDESVNEVGKSELYKVGETIKLKKGFGYWDVTQYPYGGDFGRLKKDTTATVVDGMVKYPNREVRATINKNGKKRTIVIDSIGIKESVTEAKKNVSFSKQQLDTLRKGYATIKRIDPTQQAYKKITNLLDGLSKKGLEQLTNANINFISALARNRLKNFYRESVNELDFTDAKVGDTVAVVFNSNKPPLKGKLLKLGSIIKIKSGSKTTSVPKSMIDYINKESVNEAMLSPKAAKKLKIGNTIKTQKGTYKITGYGQKTGATRNFEAEKDGQRYNLRVSLRGTTSIEVAKGRSLNFTDSEMLESVNKSEGFASDAQRKAAFASGYKAKGKKKKKESVNESEIPRSLVNKIEVVIKRALGLKKLSKVSGPHKSRVSGELTYFFKIGDVPYAHPNGPTRIRVIKQISYFEGYDDYYTTSIDLSAHNDDYKGYGEKQYTSDAELLKAIYNMAKKEKDTLTFKGDLVQESVNESNDTFFKTASDAVDYARKMIEKRGFEIDEDDWQSQIAMGGRYSRLRPGKEKTHSFSIGLLKNGKPQRKALQISLYGMPSGKYELTYYVN